MSRWLIADDLIADVRSLIDEINVENIDDETDILPALNRGQDYIASILARRYEEPLLTYTEIALEPGKSEYEIPDDAFEGRLEKLELYYAQDYYEIKRVSFRDVTRFEQPLDAAHPDFYAVIGNKFRLLPTPNSKDTLRLWYLKDPNPLVKQQGQVVFSSWGDNFIIVDELGSDLTTNSDNLNSFVNVIDKDTGKIKKTLQIKSINDTRITFRSTTLPGRSTVRGQTVSTSFEEDEIQPEDFITTVHGSCISFFKKPVSNFLVTFAATDIKVNKLGGDPGLLAKQLDAFEKQVERLWVGQEQTLRVNKVNRHWGTRRRRKLLWNP